jgi:hypothetical protein
MNDSIVTKYKGVQKIYFNKILYEIKDFFYKLWKINANIELVVGIGKQNFLSNFLKYATFNKNAHANTKISYSDQVSFLKKNTQILKIKKNIFFMTDIFYCKLNNSRISD